MKRGRTRNVDAITESAAPPPAKPVDEKRLSRQRFLLLLLIGVYISVASIHAYRAPTGATGYQDAPDEAAHMTFVRVLAAGRLPTQANPAQPGHAGPSYEWHQPPLYYALAACVLPLGEKGIRGLSIVIGIGCILAVYYSVLLLFPERPETALLAAGITALTPGHCAITSVVNNDGLLELCVSGYILLLFIALTRGLTIGLAVSTGLVMGAALLTKATALVLLPVSAVAMALLWRNGQTVRSLARWALALAGAAAFVSGWWFIRNYTLYHEWLPITAFRQSFATTVTASDVLSGKTGLPVSGWASYAALVARWTFQSFLAVYSTQVGAQFGGPSFLPEKLYLLAGLAAAATCGGLVRLLTRFRQELTTTQIHGLVILVTTLGLVAMSFILFATRYFQAQGRYFYPAMLPISCLSALGWGGLFPKRYLGLASAVLLIFLCMFCVAFLMYTA